MPSTDSLANYRRSSIMHFPHDRDRQVLDLATVLMLMYIPLNLRQLIPSYLQLENRDLVCRQFLCLLERSIHHLLTTFDIDTRDWRGSAHSLSFCALCKWAL
jgi:hypothetical protein